MKSQYLRKATEQDEARLFEWINEAEVRKNALHQHQITLKEHREWFLDKLYSKDCQIYILMENEQSIGQVRIELIKESTRITYSIDKQFRGMGYGKLLLYLVFQAVEHDFPLWNTFYAEVKKDNVASQKVFEDLGFLIQEGDNEILLYSAEKSRIEMNPPKTYGGGYCF